MHANSLKSCLTLFGPLACIPTGSSLHGIFQARILEWVAMPSSRATSWPRNRTCVSWGSCFAGRFFTTEPPVYTIELKEKKILGEVDPRTSHPCFSRIKCIYTLSLHCLAILSVIPHTVLVFSILFFCIFSPQFSHFMLRVGHDWATSLSLFTFMHWRRTWQPTPVFLPGESQGRGSRWAVVYGVAQSRTRLKWLSSSSSSMLFLFIISIPCFI